MSESGAQAGYSAPIEGFPRPVGFSETASIAWSLYAARIGSLLPTTLVVYVIFSLVQLTVLNLAVVADLSEGATSVLSIIPVYVAPAIIAAFVFALVTITAARALVGEPAARPSFGWLRGREIAVLRLGLISGVVYVAALVIAPAFQVFYPLFYGPPIFIQAVTLERDAPPGRARTLLSRQWGRVVFYLLPAAAVVGVLTLVLPITAYAGLEEKSPILAFLSVAAAQGVLSAVLLPFIAIFQLVSYLDLRARVEAFDRNALRGVLDAE